MADDGPEPLKIFAFIKAKDIVFANAATIQSETIAESAKVVEEVDCLILWHGNPRFVAILHD